MSDSSPSLLKALFTGSFERLITLKIIQVVYLLGLYGGALLFLIGWIGAAQQGEVPAVLVLFGWPVSMVVWLIFWRVMNEWAVAIFQIAENSSEFVQLARRHQTLGREASTSSSED